MKLNTHISEHQDNMGKDYVSSEVFISFPSICVVRDEWTIVIIFDCEIARRQSMG